MSILDQLNHLLSSEGMEDFDRLHSRMLENRLVREAGVSPTKEQWREYLERIRKGCEYVSKHFKSKGVPSKLVFYDDGSEFEGAGSQFICYSHIKDEFAISFPYAVQQIVCFNTAARRPREGFPPGADVSVRDYVILQAVEECHHRFYIQTEGPPDNYNPRDYSQPIEVAATKVMLQAAKDLNIPLKADPRDRWRKLI